MFGRRVTFVLCVPVARESDFGFPHQLIPVHLSQDTRHGNRETAHIAFDFCLCSTLE